MEVIDALKQDLGRELAIIDIYQKYASQVHDPEVRKILLLLISESMGHADTFRRLLYKKTMGGEMPREGLSDEALSALLDFGMKEERGVRMLYEEQLPFINDEEYAAALTRIIEDEKRHEDMLKAAYVRLSRR